MGKDDNVGLVFMAVLKRAKDDGFTRLKCTMLLCMELRAIVRSREW